MNQKMNFVLDNILISSLKPCQEFLSFRFSFAKYLANLRYSDMFY